MFVERGRSVAIALYAERESISVNEFLRHINARIARNARVSAAGELIVTGEGGCAEAWK